MKRLALKFENRIMSKVFLCLSLGLAISALTAYVLTSVAEYREFLYLLDAENEMILSSVGWVLFWLPLVMYLAMPKDFSTLSTGAISLIYLLFCSVIGAALSGISLVYIKVNIAESLFITALAFALMAAWERLFHHELMSWQCILLTAVIGAVLAVGEFLCFDVSLTDFTVTLATIVVFCAVTAYSGYAIWEVIGAGEPQKGRKSAVRGALIIYLNLVGLLLQTIQGWRRKS